MTLFLCPDDENAMRLDHRRQSLDREPIAELLSHDNITKEI